jgi:hypothetical protein
MSNCANMIVRYMILWHKGILPHDIRRCGGEATDAWLRPQGGSGARWTDAKRRCEPCRACAEPHRPAGVWSEVRSPLLHSRPLGVHTWIVA